MRIVALCLLALYSCSIYAKDLGVYGTTWDIIEIDMRQLLVQDASDVDWDRVQKGLKNGAEKYVNEPDPFHLFPAVETKTRYIDPTVVATQDIISPIVTPEGDYQWKVVVRKGESRNSLDYYRPNQNMLFYDARDEKQLNLAIAAQQEFGGRLKLVQTAGSVNPTSEITRMPVFYINQYIIDRLEIRHAPSMVGVGSGWMRSYFAVTDFSEVDYSVEKLREAWNGLDN